MDAWGHAVAATLSRSDPKTGSLCGDHRKIWKNIAKYNGRFACDHENGLFRGGMSEWRRLHTVSLPMDVHLATK
jgi:hypothetical protein